MRYSAAMLALLGSASAVPRLHSREVPQEHSHEVFLGIVRESLNLNNPLSIADPVFGLLGNQAAASAVKDPSSINLDCLKQLTADQAFTNAKAAGDVRGMAGALVYQALERNTAGVGVKSVACNETATNPEIAAIKPHQDPASDGAATNNKESALALAKQLALIGVDPLLALESGTFAPGDKSDTTFKGNSCDTENDNPGCIFSQRLLVLDATPDEISSAVSGVTATFSGTGQISATDISFSGLSVASGAAATGAGSGSSSAQATTTAAPNTATTKNNNGKAKATATTAASTTAAAAKTTGASSTDCGTVTVTVTASTANVANAAAAAGTSVTNSLPDTCSIVTTIIPSASAANLPATTTIATTGGANTAVNNKAAATTTAATGTTGSSSGTNIQSFTGTLGGTPPPVISGTGTRPFTVNGNTFTGASAALGRSCDIQHNACANAANSGKLSGGTSQCETQNTECRAAITRRAIRRGLKPLEARSNATFGSCTDPSIAFGKFDGRTENSFKPNDLSDFGHGSAQKIGIIAGFICQRLGDSCKADSTVVSTCAQASSSAVAATQDQTAADIFNSVLGVSGSSSSGSSGSSGSAGSSATATASAIATATGTQAAAAASVTTTLVVCSA